jgi:hypothetical protein
MHRTDKGTDNDLMLTDRENDRSPKIEIRESGSNLTSATWYHSNAEGPRISMLEGTVTVLE